MLIKALCDYYDILKEDGKVLPDGYSNVNVHFLVSLTPDGKIDEIINWQNTVKFESGKGKVKEKKVPRQIILPKRTEKTGIDYNIVEHRPLYIFGLNFDNDTFTPNDKTDKAKKSHSIFAEKNLQFIDGIDSPIVNAYRNFITNWLPEQETENPFLLALSKMYSNSYFAFCLSGRPDILLHEDSLLKEKWEKFLSETDLCLPEDSEVSQCAVTGNVEQIARIHNKISGLSGGLAMGNILVCFKNASENSYGKEQSYNSNISQSVMKKYTEVLNMLIKDKRHCTVLDDITVLHWAMSPNEKYDSFYSAFTSNQQMDSEQTEQMLKSLMTGAKNGNVTTDLTKLPDDIDPNVDFYIVGLKPNSSRISVKFIYRKRFGEILINIAQHQLDMQIIKNDFHPVELWQIKKELVSPKSKKQAVDPALLSKIYESVIYGTRYPEYLLSAMVKRVKTDSDTEKDRFIKINNVRAGVIKSCINRKLRFQGKKEELKLALDLENHNPAYLCGRLFAVLEKLQQDAANNSLNRTIKDSYFASASSKPAIIFPKLIKLAQNHLNKVEAKVYWNKQIGEIITKLESEFPNTLSLDEQGIFIIGYYQQYQSYFVKKENKQEEQ